MFRYLWFVVIPSLAPWIQIVSIGETRFIPFICLGFQNTRPLSAPKVPETNLMQQFLLWNELEVNKTRQELTLFGPFVPDHLMMPSPFMLPLRPPANINAASTGVFISQSDRRSFSLLFDPPVAEESPSLRSFISSAHSIPFICSTSHSPVILTIPALKTTNTPWSPAYIS
jgi:hypothetical protein